MATSLSQDFYAQVIDYIRGYVTLHECTPTIALLTLFHTAQTFPISLAEEEISKEEIKADEWGSAHDSAAMLHKIEAAVEPLLGTIRLPDLGLPPYVLNNLSMLIKLGTQRIALSSTGWDGRQIVADAFTELLEQSSRSPHEVDHITPHSLARLNAALLDVRPRMRVLDFAVGYAGTWVAVAKRLRNQGENPNSVYFVGQDVSPKVLLVATSHLMLHGITSFELRTGDALTDPRTDAGRFDRVVADPTFGLHITARNDNWRYDPRFLATRTPPRSAEWLFMMHGLSALAPRGRAVFITVHGPLFRSGSEREIRKFYTHWLTAVIALPSALYPGTSLAVALTVFDRPADHSSVENDVLMINASTLRSKDGRQNILSSEVIDRLAKLVVSGSDDNSPTIHEHVDQARLVDNDHSWQPSRYVYEPAPSVRSLEDIRSDLAAAQKTAQQAASAMKAALDALE